MLAVFRGPGYAVGVMIDLHNCLTAGSAEWFNTYFSANPFATPVLYTSDGLIENIINVVGY